MNTLDLPIEAAPKISKRILPALKRLGIRTVRDLLFHFPSRYEDYSKIRPIRDVIAGETVTVSGRVGKIRSGFTAIKRMRVLEATVSDGTGSIKAVWYNQPFLARGLREGDILNLSGKAALGKHGLFLQSPAHEKKFGQGGKEKEMIHTGGLVAIYPETAGVTSRWLRFLMKSHIHLRQNTEDLLPSDLKKKYGLLEIGEALRLIHFPECLKDAQRARERFGFESIFLFQLHALLEKLRIRQYRAAPINPDVELLKRFAGSLPYTLTSAQKKAIWEIAQDISRARPMNRLLEGDVGSGKTIVAAAAALLAVKQKLKVAFMSPTEILARQHFETLELALTPFGIKIGLLTATEKKYSGAEIIVGTHALIQKKNKFENLGLVIVDEQHRFGVKQRAALSLPRRDLRLAGEISPHFLSMSATPIPRTLLLAVYGDLDVSVLDEAPKHKKEIITKIIKSSERNEAYAFIREEVKKGRQVFVVCPRIETAVNTTGRAANSQQKLLFSEIKAVKEEHKKLAQEIFSDLRVGMLHGRMRAEAKKNAVKDFKNGKIDILVSTSVIEVGIDIPNATIMLIEGAERFGLAQLHQLRGRVGRGGEQSHCLLFTSGAESPDRGIAVGPDPSGNGVATERLQALVGAKTGSELAEMDLKLRGPGDVFGVEQSGRTEMLSYAIAHPELVRAARFDATELIKKDPGLKHHPGLLKYLREKEKILHME